MKRMKRAFLACLILLQPCMMTACSNSAEDSDVSKINLINDVGRPVEVNLCKGDPHCESLEKLWHPMQLGINESKAVTVSNQVRTIFRVSSEINGKPSVTCLRLRLDKAQKTSQDVLLSTAADC